MFGGVPAGRRGLSNALYSVDLARLSVGDGIWERHRPSGAAPAPRHGHTLTVVGGGERLVLFGGIADNGELLGDIQVRTGVWRAVVCWSWELDVVRMKRCTCTRFLLLQPRVRETLPRAP